MPSVPIARPAASSRLWSAIASAALAGSLVLAGASAIAAEDQAGSVVATTEVLGSIVSQIVGDAAEVTVVMPSGADPHSYEPSARDAERILDADIVVSVGLDLEEALLSVLEAAEGDGVTWFEAAGHVAVRDLEAADDGHEEADHDHGADDPHIWTDPLAMRDVVLALGPVLADAGVKVGEGAAELAAELEALDAEVEAILASVPPEARQLVTGHRSLGYFADRYGFEQIGTVIPGLSTSGEPSARELAQLIEDIKTNGVSAVFTEVGTPASVAEAVATDSGAALVPLSTSRLPDEGTYQDLITDLATTVADALSE